MLATKKHKEQLQSFEDRKQGVEDFVHSINPNITFKKKIYIYIYIFIHTVYIITNICTMMCKTHTIKSETHTQKEREHNKN